jgi:hypothetical protein
MLSENETKGKKDTNHVKLALDVPYRNQVFCATVANIGVDG